MTYSLGLSFTRFFNKFSHDRQEKKNDKSTVQKFEYLESERCFFGKLKAVVARRCSVRKSVLRNFAKFTGKHLCQSLFLIKLQVLGLRPATLLKRDSGTCVFL